MHRPIQAATFASTASSSHSGLASAGRELAVRSEALIVSWSHQTLGDADHADTAGTGEPFAAGRVDRVGTARGVDVAEGLGRVHPQRHIDRAA